MYRLELTAKQLEALESAIDTHAASFDGFTDEELREWDVKRDLLALRQVQTKIDKIAERVEA